MAEGRTNTNAAPARTSTSATPAMNNPTRTEIRGVVRVHLCRVGARDLWPKGAARCARRATGSYMCEQSCVMPRLLLVAYHFPPEPTAAAVRLGQVATNLPQFGWQVSVVARPRDAAPQADGVVRTP